MLEKKRKRARDWKKNNPDKNKKITQNWKKNNKEHISKYNSKYNIENREQIQKRQTIQHRERRQYDINYKLAINCRNKIKKFYKGQHKTNKLISCDINFLKKWFLFLDPKLDFEEYGFDGWHMDHIIPCALFNLQNEDELKHCFHWSNIQPLNGKLNMSKQDKITKKEIEIYETKLIDFCKKNKITTPSFNRYRFHNE